ncbi:MAG: polysaccharide deacetylase family protein [Candidatus Lokiarchaeota archaeon]|nr:polysaccharide deacetylase family protein [Candidatus Lokiarchaeota archaeon]
MTFQVIIRVDDIFDRYDFFELYKWFLSHYPEIPISFYIQNTHLDYLWDKSTWRKIKEVIKNYNWEIGGHSRNHPHLSKIADELLIEEIINNVLDIEKNLREVGLNYNITSFAYPYGDYDERIISLLQKNGLFHGLTYSIDNSLKNKFANNKENSYVIGISCNGQGSIEDWNNKFKKAYEKGDFYILCLHTPHWSRGSMFRNILRLMKAKHYKELYYSLRRFFRFSFEKNMMKRWKILQNHIDFIKSHPYVHFSTYKDQIGSK